MGADNEEPDRLISRDELLARLANRRGVRVDGDRIILRARPRAVLLTGLSGLLMAGFLVSLYVRGTIGSEFAADPLPIALMHVVPVPLLAFAISMLVGPALVVDPEGLHRRRLSVPWDEPKSFEWVHTGRHAGVRALLAEDSAVIAALPAWRRWFMRRTARNQRVVAGVRVPIAATNYLSIDVDEMRALVVMHAKDVAAEPVRPPWEEVIATLRGRPGVEVAGQVLVARDGERELLRIDDVGVHAPMPDAWRTVGWEQLADVSWYGPKKRPNAVLFLHPGVTGSDLRGRTWRALRRQGRPAAVIPWSARAPFDLLTFATLLAAHPRSRHS